MAPWQAIHKLLCHINLSRRRLIDLSGGALYIMFENHVCS